MIKQKRGKILNISSIAAVLDPVGHAAYSASKGSLNLLIQTMAAEWGRYNIQDNAIAPTVILTAMGKKVRGEADKAEPMKARSPAGRFGEPSEVADLVISGRDAIGLEKTRESVERFGRRCHAVQADLSSIEETYLLANQALELFSTVDILVNSAGVVFVEPAEYNC
jgi:NAD(P)-dependent dehydrogenase (short-subunit alcohol dehydrogenase family)